MLKFPGALLWICLLIGLYNQFLMGNSVLDIHLHDTYFVTVYHSYPIRIYFSIPVWGCIIISLAIHFVVRRWRLLPLWLRWAQVGITLLSLICKTYFFYRAFSGTGPGWHTNFTFLRMSSYTMYVFYASQWIFWIGAVIGGIRNSPRQL